MNKFHEFKLNFYCCYEVNAEYSVRVLPLVEIHICMLLKFVIKCIAGADAVGHALCAAKNNISLNIQFLPITSSNMMMSSETVIHYCSGILMLDIVISSKCD